MPITGHCVFQKLLIERRSILERFLLPVEIHVIRVNVDQRQTAMPGDPIELAFPQVDPPFSQYEEEGGILGQRVRQLDVTRVVRAGDPEREQRVHALGLGLERIIVEGGRVPEDVEILEPVQIMKHESGAKADGVPRVQVIVDSFRLRLEVSP